jgi:Meckel syndrome type 1 protein
VTPAPARPAATQAQPAPRPEVVVPPPVVVTQPLPEPAPAAPPPTAAERPTADPDAPITTRPQPLD